MVRAIAPVRTVKGERTVLLPGATEAEPWEIWTTGADARCLKVCPRPEKISARNDTVLALPVGQVVALPLWLQETDPKQFRGMIELQLEARGLQPRGHDTVFEWAVTVQEEARTLVLVAVLAAVLPEELETDAFSVFELSAHCFPLPSDALVLWMEQDRLVAAITCGDRLAYYQALCESRPTARVLQDLTCIMAALQMQEVVSALKQIVVWTYLTPAECQALQSTLGLPVQQSARPVPTLPREAWNLTPARVDEAKRRRETRRWQLRAVGLLAGLAIVAAVALGFQLLLAAREVGRLQHWQATHAGSLQVISDTRAAWSDLQPVIDRDAYPLEALRNVTESLPVDQAHLTLFEQEGSHLLIKAEAKNLTAAFQFFDQLKKNPHLKTYTFNMAQPHSLANDITQIQIEGTHASDD